MSERKIIVKNLFGDNRSATVNGKEYLFTAYQERKVPETFLLSNGELKFAYLTLLGFAHDDGSVLVVNEEIQEKFENKEKTRFVFELTNTETGEKTISDSLTDIAIKLELDYKGLKTIFNLNKNKFKGFGTKKYSVEEYKEINPDFFKDK